MRLKEQQQQQRESTTSSSSATSSLSSVTVAATSDTQHEHKDGGTAATVNVVSSGSEQPVASGDKTLEMDNSVVATDTTDNTCTDRCRNMDHDQRI